MSSVMRKRPMARRSNQVRSAMPEGYASVPGAPPVLTAGKAGCYRFPTSTTAQRRKAGGAMRSLRRRAVVVLTGVTAMASLLPNAAKAVSGPTPPVGTTDRIAGTDRYDTAVKISTKIPLGPKYVVLARGDVFAD